MSTTKMDKSTIIKLVVTFGIPIIILLIPTNEIYTAQMRMAIALTVGFLIWCAVELTDMVVPALLWPALLILTNTVPAATVYSSYLNTTYFGIAAAFVWTAVLERSGVLKRLCFFIVSKSKGSYLSIAIFLFLAGFVISTMTFATACLVIAIICASFVKTMKIEKTETAAVIMMVGMLAASTVRMFLYYPLMQGCILSSVRAVNPEFSFGFVELFIYNWPVFIYCILFIVLMVFLTKKSYTLTDCGKEWFAEELKSMGKMSRDEKMGAISIAIVMVWIMSNPITNLDSMLSFIIAVAFLYFPGVNAGTARDVASVNIGMLLFFAACMGIGAVCSYVGITAWMSTTLVSLLGSMNLTLMLLLVLFIGFLLNFAMTPVAMLAGFSGMFYSIFVSMGIDPLAAIFTFNYSTDMVLLPYEYVTFLLFFSMGCISVKQFFKYHALKCITFVLFFAAIIIPYWYLIGLI